MLKNGNSQGTSFFKASFILVLTLCAAFFIFCANAQELTGKIENHENSQMELVLMLFGMEKPISIGTVDKKAQFTASLDNISTDQISEEDIAMYIGELYFSFYFECKDREVFGENFDKPAARQDYVRLTKNGEWAGTVFLVSNEGLRPWLEDPGYNNAIRGSFYEVIYVEANLSLKMTCNSSIYADDNTEVETEYSFEIELKNGFNWVEYTILEVYETNPDIRASFPSKVSITNSKDPLKCFG
jgi:hypothetical protein